MHPRNHHYARDQHQNQLPEIERAEALLAHVDVVEAFRKMLVHAGGVCRDERRAAVLVEGEAVRVLVGVVVDDVVLEALPLAVDGRVDPHPGFALVGGGGRERVGDAVLALVVAVEELVRGAEHARGDGQLLG